MAAQRHAAVLDKGTFALSTIARLSLAEYERMIERGVFDERARRRLEFVRGEIREMSPIGPWHAWVVERLDRLSQRNLPEQTAWIRVQNPIRLPGVESMPEPDLVWAMPHDYSRRPPDASEVLLVIEVADSSLDYDRGEKAEIYAAAEIAEYWVVNLLERTVEVFREPMQERYTEVQVYAGNQEFRALAFPQLVLRPVMIF